MNLLTVLAALVTAIVGAGGVAIYTAKPQRDSIIAAASKNAVDVVNSAIEHLEADNDKLRTRVGELEDELAVAVKVGEECRHRIRTLTRAVVELGGVVDHGDDVQDGADAH